MYFVYIKDFETKPWKKRPGVRAISDLRAFAKNKKGAGREWIFAPLYTRFAFERWFAVIQLEIGTILLSSGQNLAALGTTASQNLTAVCGSHSLTETVDLGTMTLSGLVGTLHVVTPPNKISYARQTVWLQQHIMIDHRWSC